MTDGEAGLPRLAHGPVIRRHLACDQLFGSTEPRRHRRIRASQVLVVVDSEQPDPALLAKR